MVGFSLLSVCDLHRPGKDDVSMNQARIANAPAPWIVDCVDARDGGGRKEEGEEDDDRSGKCLLLLAWPGLGLGGLLTLNDAD